MTNLAKKQITNYNVKTLTVEGFLETSWQHSLKLICLVSTLHILSALINSCYYDSCSPKNIGSH